MSSSPPSARARSPLPASCEVLVVGGGPAGAATAGFLARAGRDVVLVDRARFPRAKACAEYVSPEAARPLAALGVLDAIEAARPAQLAGMTVFAPDGGTIHGAFVAAHGFRGFRDRGLGIPRTTLDPLLLAHARALGVRVHEGVKVDAIDAPGSDGTRLVRLREDGMSRTVRARIVVGADGLRSIVARRLDLARRAPWPWPRRLALVAHYRGIADVGDHGEMHVTRDGYVGIAAVGDGLVNVALVVPTSRAGSLNGDPAGFLTAWLARVPRLAPRFRHALRVTPVLATGPFAQHAPRAWTDGVALVGDAADFFDPFTGEGIYAALRGAELLAPHVDAALHARTRPDARAALAAYEHDRRAAFRGKWRVERAIGAAVAVPALMNHAARVLTRRRDLADLLIGVTGDFVPATEVLRPRALLPFLRPSFGRAASASTPSPTLRPTS